jgi:hypothetical protein
MFQVVPEPEFEAWYETLPEPLAEEVATAIDMAASFGGALAPERLSRLLLWFDGTGTGNSDELGVAGLNRGLLERLPEVPLARAQHYLVWQQEVLLALESTAFTQRLAQLDPSRAALALKLVERVKRRLHAARLSGNVSPWRTAGGGQAEPDPAGVRAAFVELLQLLGLEQQTLLGSGSGLRELCIGNVQPPLRVLFGLDFPAKRLLAILGEPLERRYYGDSVKRAEERWQEYLVSSRATRSSRRHEQDLEVSQAESALD